MLKKTIKYIDPWTQEEVEDDFYFHFTEIELGRMAANHTDLPGELRRITTGDSTSKEVVAFFEEMISKSFGERIDGRFVKSADITNAFLSSEPYSALIMSFFRAGDGGKDAAEFMDALMPAALVARAEEAMANGELPSDQVSQERLNEMRDRLAERREGRTVTDEGTGQPVDLDAPQGEIGG